MTDNRIGEGIKGYNRSLKKEKRPFGSFCCGANRISGISGAWDARLIPGPAQWVKDRVATAAAQVSAVAGI